MKCKYVVMSLHLLILGLWTCCSDKNQEIEGNEKEDEEVINLPDDEDDNIENSTFSSLIKITYDGSAVTIENPLNDTCVNITVEGAKVVVNSIEEEVEYEVSGSTSDGYLKIYSEKKFKLTLAGVSIKNTESPAINIQSHKRVFVELKENTVNQLEDGLSYASSTEDQKAAFFSEGQLIFLGNGSLELVGNYKHALCSDDYIRITSGNITVKSAVNDGIHTSDAFLMDGGLLDVACVGDAVQCENTVSVNAGTLTLRTSGDKGHALACESDMALLGGNYTINVSGAASKGIKCDGNLTISDGTYNITTTGTGMYESGDSDVSGAAGIKCGGACSISGSETEISCTSTGKGGKGMSIDGILTISDATIMVKTSGSTYSYSSYSSSAKGIRSDSDIVINSGKISISATGGENCEGLESKKTITINGGTVEIVTYDDAMNASNNITVNGGYVYCYATNNDGMDSNGTFNINGGVIVASGTTTPEEGMDCDQNQFTVMGGTFIATGGATSSPTTNSSTQNSVVYGGSGSQNVIFRVEKSDGTEILTYSIPRSMNSMTYLFSSPTLVNGDYVIYMGGSVSGGTDFHGLYFDTVYDKGSATSTTFTVSSKLTTMGNASGGGTMPGGPGGGMWGR